MNKEKTDKTSRSDEEMAAGFRKLALVINLFTLALIVGAYFVFKAQ